MTPHSLSDLARTIERERDYLLHAGAALQLMPQNATKWARFERLLEVVSAAAPSSGQRPVSKGRLRQLLTTPPIATPQVIVGEDPFEESFTACISFYGGSYRVVMGGASGAHAACQLVLEAVRQLPHDPHAAYKTDVLGDALLLLKLSEAVCDRVGLRRWELPVYSPQTELRVPPKAELERLSGAVTFTQGDLANLLGPRADQLPRLIAPGRMTLVDHDDESPTDDRIYVQPLVDLGDGSVVVALPSGLAASIAHRTLALAAERNMTRSVAEALHEALGQAIHRYAERVRWKQLATPSKLDPLQGVSEAFYRFDTDKIAHVVGVVDPLVGYTAGKPFAPADLRLIQEKLHQRFSPARNAIRSRFPDTFILHLVCSASLGRSSAIGFTADVTDDKSVLLTVVADDLDVMTRIEAPDPLGLWKFAVAADRLRDESDVLSTSSLDVYAIYRNHGNGFYMGDDRKPTGLWVAPGTGGELRAKERLRLDQHAAVLPDGDHVVEVVRWPADDETPVYRPDIPTFGTLRLVEIAAPCWVVPVPNTAEEAEASEDFAEAVAFWLWRCRDMVAAPLAAIVAEHRALVVNVRFMAQSIDDDGDDDLEPVGRWLTWNATPGEDHVDLTLLDGAAARLRGPGNEGERIVAGAVVEAVHYLAGLHQSGLGQQVANTLPAGPMKMLQVFGIDDDLFLAFGYTAPPRLVPAADVELLLDEVGVIATDVLHLPEGPIPDDERTRVLNEIVGELFTRLQTLMSELDLGLLLEHLAAEQEAITFLEARNKLLIPSQAACFGDDSSAVRRAIGSARDLTSTALANRFIIECATAIVPSGTRHLSVGLYDQMLALAKQIVDYGFLSDAIRYGLSATELSVLRSGRLGLSRTEPYQQALAEYISILSGRSLGAARRGFARHWATASGDGEPFDPTDLNDAFEAEFGLTATELSQLSGELMQMARNERRQIATRSLEGLVTHLMESLDISYEKAGSAIELLALGPLEKFPPATNPVDTFPWRFSRNRSAARRPLLLHTGPDGDTKATWGPRSVYRSGAYLIDQIHSGRLKAQTGRMREYLNTARQAANAEFNREVAAFYRQNGYQDVRENVKRVGKLRLTRASGDEIGDIDVLVIDRAKKVILAVEVKDFEFARTPFELSNEIQKLLDGPDSAVHHHKERLNFIKANLDQILTELELPGPANHWQVQGQVVTSHNLMAAHFPMVQALGRHLTIVAFEDLVARDPNQLTVRRKDHPATRADRRSRRRRR